MTQPQIEGPQEAPDEMTTPRADLTMVLRQTTDELNALGHQHRILWVAYRSKVEECRVLRAQLIEMAGSSIPLPTADGAVPGLLDGLAPDAEPALNGGSVHAD